MGHVHEYGSVAERRGDCGTHHVLVLVLVTSDFENVLVGFANGGGKTSTAVGNSKRIVDGLIPSFSYGCAHVVGDRTRGEGGGDFSSVMPPSAIGYGPKGQVFPHEDDVFVMLATTSHVGGASAGYSKRVIHDGPSKQDDMSADGASMPIG
jgi:hypothetical protein